MSTTVLQEPKIATSSDFLHIHPNIISTTGRTPLIRLNRLTRGIDATVVVKGEFFLSTTLAEKARLEVSA